MRTQKQHCCREAYRVVKEGGLACMIGPVHPTFFISRFFADMWMLFPTEQEYVDVSYLELHDAAPLHIGTTAALLAKASWQTRPATEPACTLQWYTKAGFEDVKVKRIGPRFYRGVRAHGLIMGCSVTGIKPKVRGAPLWQFEGCGLDVGDCALR
jgi:MPBQ/MSBQ methyltransferase